MDISTIKENFDKTLGEQWNFKTNSGKSENFKGLRKLCPAPPPPPLSCSEGPQIAGSKCTSVSFVFFFWGEGRLTHLRLLDVNGKRKLQNKTVKKKIVHAQSLGLYDHTVGNQHQPKGSI